jgi:hypothetical protein
MQYPNGVTRFQLTNQFSGVCGVMLAPLDVRPSTVEKDDSSLATERKAAERLPRRVTHTAMQREMAVLFSIRM